MKQGIAPPCTRQKPASHISIQAISALSVFQDPLGGYQEKACHTGEINEIGPFNYPASHAGVMRFDAELLYPVIGPALENRDSAYTLKSNINDKTPESAQQKTDDGVGCKRRAKYPDCGKNGHQHQQANIGPGNTARVNAVVEAELPDGDYVNQGWKKRQNTHRKCRQKFSTHNLPEAERAGTQQFPGAGAKLIAEATHGDSGYEHQQNPGGEFKKLIEGGVAVVENGGIGKNKQEQPHQQQKQPDAEVARKPAEKLTEVF